ncbi:hypothetical protein chiPu_0011745 [Chiloscyllium punctatum]|uniref:Uncharacterized protein n=1 Tax=Chiloscyllium punctatum TaxID=137246 RepID=A0A401SSC5_CHIPU|nr:hypothetical protein [Chiloscyllium punctatum]
MGSEAVPRTKEMGIGLQTVARRTESGYAQWTWLGEYAVDGYTSICWEKREQNGNGFKDRCCGIRVGMCSQAIRGAESADGLRKSTLPDSVEIEQSWARGRLRADSAWLTMTAATVQLVDFEHAQGAVVERSQDRLREWMSS